MIKYTLGWITLFESFFFIVPMIAAVVYWENAFFAFLISALICAAIGTALIIKKPKDTTIYASEGFVIVSLCWVALSIFGALPFMFTGVTNYSFVDALFETVSGFTTTGASIFTAVEWLPKSILLWRSFTHWVGGMGVLVFVMAFLPLGGGQNLHIMRAESPGPEVSKLVPKVKNTAIILYVIYFVMTVIFFITLLIADMHPFDALNTAFATAGTGGFGIRDNSLGFATPLQQVLVTIAMLLFSINFNSYYLILKLKFKEAFNSEVRAFICVVAAAITIITVNVYTNDLAGQFDSIGEALRHSAFTVASIISTSGFATVDFNLWPSLAKTIIVLLMFIGACAGSTGGGMKVSRFVILIKGLFRELGAIVHPKQVKRISIDDRPLDREVVRSVNAYVVCFVLVFASSLIIVSFDNKDLITNFTAIATTINNVGPGLGEAGPASNFAGFSDLSKLVMCFDMLAGRLELFPMLILFSPSTWKKA